MDIHVHEADSKEGAVSHSEKRMTMASSPEGCRPPWEAEARARKAKEKCMRCEEWKRKFREQNVSYFRESGHYWHAIKKLLSRCADSMPEKQYRQLEQSLQLDVRFFSEHNAMDTDFLEDFSGFGRGDAEAMAELKEKNASLEEENEALERKVEELEAGLRLAHDEAVALKRSQRPERPTTAPDKAEVHCQTGPELLQQDEDITFQVDHTELVKKELDKVTMSRDSLATALQASQQEVKAAALERKALEQRVRELMDQLERKINAAIPGEKMPQMGHIARRARKTLMSDRESPNDIKETSLSEVDLAAQSFSEQVAESDARVQGTIVVPDEVPPEADQASLEVEGSGTTAAESAGDGADAAPLEEAEAEAPKAKLGSASFAELTTRLFQERSAGVQTEPPETSDFGMQVQEWDLEGGGGLMRLRANMTASAQEHAITRKTKAFGKSMRETAKFSVGGAPGGVRPLSGGTFAATTTASRRPSRQSGEHKRSSTAMLAKLPKLSDNSPIHEAVAPGSQRKQAWDGRQEAAAGLLPHVARAIAAAAAMSGSRSAGELGAAGERTATPQGLAREMTQRPGSTPLLGVGVPPRSAGSDGPGRKKKHSKVKEKEPEPYLYEVWEKYPDSHKKPSDAELVKLGACRPPPPPESEEASSEQASGAGVPPADA